MSVKRLLLVEDDRALAELVTFHFERAGYSVTRTGDGEAFDRVLVQVERRDRVDSPGSGAQHERLAGVGTDHEALVTAFAKVAPPSALEWMQVQLDLARSGATRRIGNA